jgi:alpha-L-fucosidase
MALALTAQAQPVTQLSTVSAKETPAQFARRTKWWREARFGMFIHWGVYAVPADSTKGLGEWYMHNTRMQVKDYERFVPQFNPVRFNARQWVKVAKDAGMKYIVITSKHHDGFAMFDSQVSDYTIVKATPFKRDVMKELARECQKQGIKLCFYYSIMDWHHPDYLPRRDWEKETRPAAGADFDRYVTYMKAQLKELVTQYGPLGVLWFDGEWENTWNHERGKDLYQYVRSLQPNILINNRVDKGRAGMAGMTTDAKYAGDFGTPEQEVPPQGFQDDRLWETCMTLNDTWGYARNDHNWKSVEQLIHTLVDVAHKGGNLLLNVGPTDLGEFTPETLDRLSKMGDWMKKNGKAIHGTTKSPFKKLPSYLRCTRKGNTLFLHVFRWPESGTLTVPGLKTAVRAASVLATGTPVTVTTAPEGIQLERPVAPDSYATVIELRLAGPPEIADAVATTQANPDGRYTLTAEEATLHGSAIRLEAKGGQQNIGFWTNREDTVEWSLQVRQARRYQVEIEYACAPESAGSAITVQVGETRLTAQVESTGGWETFRTLTLPAPIRVSGRTVVRVVPQTMPHGAVMNLRRITLRPMRE